MVQQTTWQAGGRRRRAVALSAAAAALLVWVTGCSSGTAAAPSSATHSMSQEASAAPSQSEPPSTPVVTTPPAASPTTAPPTVAAVIYGCDQQSVARPKEFILLCGDAGEVLKGLTWSNWGKSTATATGQLWQKSCDPNCAGGKTVQYSATVTLTGLKGGSYTAMHIAAPKAPSPTADFTLGPDGPGEVQNG